MKWDAHTGSLDLGCLGRAYADGTLAVADVAEAVLARIEDRADDAVWIHRLPAATLRAHAAQLDGRRRVTPDWRSRWPLLGVPFAIKDNFDVAGLPTTAANPAFAYVPDCTAAAVQRLLDAGALLVGKTNLDQFATGLTGTRSPFGIPVNPFNARIIPGGSSSGSAVAVATGLVSFALGTDTAGSGRVPAALNNIVGLKPSRGVISTSGVVPACKSLDCVSVFALGVADAMLVYSVCAGFDRDDPYARADVGDFSPTIVAPPGRFRFGIPDDSALEFFGDTDGADYFRRSIAMLEAIGGERVPLRFDTFREVAGLLYGGPWVAERYLTLAPLLARDPEAVHPAVRAALADASRYSAADAFEAMHRLAALKRVAREALATVDCLVTPTVARPFTIDEATRDPVGTHARLGYYTNFANLLDLCAIAVPTVMRRDRLPFGVTLYGAALADNHIAAIAGELHRKAELPLGAGTHRLGDQAPPPTGDGAHIRICVVGSHMSGLPLNHELIDCDARLVACLRTASEYRLFVLSHLSPPRPGMVRVANGAALDVEVWELPVSRLGRFVAKIPPPLTIGTVTLEDGDEVKGFLCEAYALQEADDISRFGGWRGYLRTKAIL